MVAPKRRSTRRPQPKIDKPPLPGEGVSGASAEPVKQAEYRLDTTIARVDVVDWARKFREFVRGAMDVPYADLLNHMKDNGWSYSLHERNVLLGETKSAVTTDINVFHKDMDVKFSYGVSAGSYTLMIPLRYHSPNDGATGTNVGIPGAGVTALSVVAGVLSPMSIVYTLFRRLPDPPAASQDGGGPVEPPPPEPLEAEEEVPMAVADTTPVTSKDIMGDGGPGRPPVFKDLYSIKKPSDEIISTLLTELEVFMPQVKDVDALMDLYKSNEAAIQFVRDLGSTSDLTYLQKLFTKRKARLTSDASEVVH